MPKGKPKLKVNKSQWIREQSLDLTPKELVELAAKKAIKLTPQQVYTVRHEAKKRAGKKSGPKPKAAAVAAPTKTKVKAAVAVAAHPSASSTVRQEFVRLATRLGTDEMRRLIEQMDAQV